MNNFYNFLFYYPNYFYIGNTYFTFLFFLLDEDFLFEF